MAGDITCGVNSPGPPMKTEAGPLKVIRPALAFAERGGLPSVIPYGESCND